MTAIDWNTQAGRVQGRYQTARFQSMTVEQCLEHAKRILMACHSLQLNQASPVRRSDVFEMLLTARAWRIVARMIASETIALEEYERERAASAASVEPELPASCYLC
jgi:hypothetical protein